MPPEEIDTYDLSSEYREIRDSFNMLVNLLGDVGDINFRGSSDNLDIKNIDNRITVDPEGMFRIVGVGFDSGSPGEIDICIRPDTTIIGVKFDGGKIPVIVTCNTAVSYLKIVGSGERSWKGDREAKVLSAFHYDFEWEPKDRHPIFHTQFEPSSIELGVLNRQYNIQNPDRVTNATLNHPRIPTPPLDFPGVLYMLFHEHRDDVDRVPLENTNLIGKLPTFPPWCFEPSPLCNGTLIPEWWYFASQDVSTYPNKLLTHRGYP